MSEINKPQNDEFNSEKGKFNKQLESGKLTGSGPNRKKPCVLCKRATMSSNGTCTKCENGR